jgi:hypothetical protein
MKLTWLLDILKAAGLKVAPVDGWELRGRGEMSPVRGILCHHTAGPKTGNMPSLNIVTNGRGAPNPLPGPLCHLGLGRDGTWYIVAAGKAVHAGNGEFKGITAGNSSMIGIEAENSGTADDPWPDVQMRAYEHGVAAMLKHLNLGVDCCVAGHKEFALPRGRKPDPSFDMNQFRANVQAILSGAAPAPQPIPAVDNTGRPTLRRGARGEDVKTVQRKLGLQPDGIFGANTESRVREFQRSHGLVPDGIIGPKTWALIVQ